MIFKLFCLIFLWRCISPDKLLFHKDFFVCLQWGDVLYIARWRITLWFPIDKRNRLCAKPYKVKRYLAVIQIVICHRASNRMKRLPYGRVSGAAERQRVCEANEQRSRPAKACRAGMPLKGAVCNSRLGLRKKALAAQAQVPRMRLELTRTLLSKGF